jgi:outer membrane protein assembly factor BamD
MRFAPARLATTLCFLASLCLSTVVRADLVWTAQGGWRVEGGSLSGLTGAEGRNALDQMNKARTAEEKGSIYGAAKTYENIAKKWPNSIYAPEALYRAARLHLSGKSYNKAFDDFQSVLGRYPNTKRFNEIVGEQYRIASTLLDGARGRMLRGLLPGFKQREKAVEYFEIILQNAPYSDYAPLSLMNIARAHQRLDNIPEAIDALDRMVNFYPQSLLAPDAYLKLAQTHATLVDGPYYDQANTKESITYFEDFMILFPSDPSVNSAEKGLDGMKKMLAESKMKIADFYFHKRSNYKAAKVFYNEAITAYPDSEVAKRAKGKLLEVEAKAEGKPVPPEAKVPGEAAPKKKRFWLF